MTAPPRTRSGRYGSHVRASGAGLELWVYDVIDADFGVNAGDLVRQVHAAGPVPVTLRIDSPGGDVFSSLALYECLRTHPAPVTVYVDGHAASAASVIAMAARTWRSRRAASCAARRPDLDNGNEADHLAAAKLLGQVSAMRSLRSTRPGRGHRGRVAQGDARRSLVHRVEAVAPDWWTGSSRCRRRCRRGARDHRATARRQRSPRRRRGARGAAAGVPGSSLAGVVAVAAGGPARRPAGRRATPSVLPLLKAMKAARR